MRRHTTYDKGKSVHIHSWHRNQVLCYLCSLSSVSPALPSSRTSSVHAHLQHHSKIVQYFFPTHSFGFVFDEIGLLCICTNDFIIILVASRQRDLAFPRKEQSTPGSFHIVESTFKMNYYCSTLLKPARTINDNRSAIGGSAWEKLTQGGLS